MDTEASNATTPAIKKPFGAATPKRLITNSDKLNNNYNIFDDFEKPAASIDFISISLSHYLPTPEVAESRLKAIQDTGARYNYSDRWSPGWENDFLTIHDPSKATIDYLIGNHGNVTVRGIEISLDYFLEDGSNNPDKLRALHSHLAHSLCPGHGLKRKIFVETGGGKGFYAPYPCNSKMMNTGSTVIWEAIHARFKIRLYIKTLDNKKPIDRHRVRLEITLTAAELERQFNPDDGEARAYRMNEDGPFRLYMFPRLFSVARRYLSDFFYVASGITPELKRTRATGTRAETTNRANDTEVAKVSKAWTQYGALWAMENNYKVKPDARANREIGRALDEFQRHFSG